MSSTEQSLWQWLERGTRFTESDELQMTRVENAASSGLPDVEGFLACGGHFWVELKVCERPKDVGKPVRVHHIRAKQVQWVHNRALMGGRVWILLRVEGANAPRAHYLLYGRHARAVAAGLTEKEMCKRSAVNHAADPLDIVRAAALFPLNS